MGPYYYVVEDISGDYANLKRTDIADDEPMLVALALLPDGIDIGARLCWENLEYTVIE
ncbi:MAG: chorismate--pyruvate lyase [Ruminiclostridium sp.]